MHPEAEEQCDQRDNDCDSETDEDVTCPQAEDDIFSTSEDAVLVTGSVFDNDEPLPGTELQIESFDDNGVAGVLTCDPVLANGTFSYDPNGQFEYLDTGETADEVFSYIAADSEGAITAAATVTITINGVNDAPAADPEAEAIDEDSVLRVTPTGMDVDEEPLVFEITSQPSHGTAILTEGTLTYDPDRDYYGLDSFTYRANDGSTTSLAVPVTVRIYNVQDAPIAEDQSYSTGEDIPLAVILDYSDPDLEDILDVYVTSGPEHGALTGAAPNLVYTPEKNYHGNDGFQYRVIDGYGGEDSANVSIVVMPINDAPFILSVIARWIKAEAAAVVFTTAIAILS